MRVYGYKGKRSLLQRTSAHIYIEKKNSNEIKTLVVIHFKLVSNKRRLSPSMILSFYFRSLLLVGKFVKLLLLTEPIITIGLI